MWILSALLYGVFIGTYNLTRKQMLKKSGILISAAIYSLISFICVSWMAFFIMPMEPKFIALLFTKAIIMALAMYFTIYSLKKLEVSKVTLLSCFSIVVSVLGARLIFSEKLSALQISGVLVVLLGLVFVAMDKKNKPDGNIVQNPTQKTLLPTIYAFFASLLNASSGFLDKYIMRNITTFQMQFWFMLFVALIYWAILFIVCIRKKQWLITKSDLKNVWIYLSGVLLSVACLFLFWAYSYTGSKVGVVTVLSKLSLVVAFIGGIIFFKDNKHWQKFVYFGIILAGIVLLSL